MWLNLLKQLTTGLGISSCICIGNCDVLYELLLFRQVCKVNKHKNLNTVGNMHS